MIAKSRKFKANDQHTMTMDNVPLVLPTSVCKGVRTLDVGIAAAEEAGLSVSAALLASRAPDSLLYMTLRHYHILPPSLARVPRIGHASLRAWWSEMYSEILETMGPRGGGYGLLLELFETPLVFEACDRARLVELFDSIGIIVAEPVSIFVSVPLWFLDGISHVSLPCVVIIALPSSLKSTSLAFRILSGHVPCCVLGSGGSSNSRLKNPRRCCGMSCSFRGSPPMYSVTTARASCRAFRGICSDL